MRSVRIALTALFAAAVLQGCGDDGSKIVNPPVSPTPTLSAVQVTPSTLQLEEGETFQLTATPVDQDGEAMDVAVTWSSADESVATVDAEGLVTAVVEGQAEILAEADGDDGTVTGKAALSVIRPGEVVPVAGGTVTYLSGAVVLEIPDGALAEPTKITIRPSGADVAGEQPGMVGSTSYQFRPEGLLFQKQARLTIRYETGNVPAGVIQERLSLYHRTQTGWAEVTGSEVDTAARTVSGPVESFSHYGVKESGRAEVDRVVVSGTASEPIPIGGTVQLTATLFDADGNILDGPRWKVAWTSSADAVATVDETGLVTGAARGSSTITATSEGVSGSAQVRVSGSTGEEEEGGTNMSWPAVFADGVGLTGLPVAEDPGVRPTVESGIAVDALPFFWEDNAPDYGEYYLQRGENVWRAEYVDGTGQPPYDASAYWGDNLTVRSWSATRPIRVEVALSATAAEPMVGFNMTYLYGQGPTEVQGTDGTTGEFVPLIYTVGPTFVVEKLDGLGGAPTATVLTASIGTEVNVAGRIIYGHQLRLNALGYGEGYYRFRFILADGANVILQSVGNSGDDELTYLPEIVSPSETRLDVYVTP